MTWSTTHIGISTALLFIVLPKSKRNTLQQHPIAFFVVSLAAILPDIDLYLPIPHRTWTHSFFIIASYLLLTPLLAKLTYHFFSDYYSESEYTLFLRVFGLLWISHVVYDITFGPIAMFYPIDKRYFDLEIGIILNLATATVSFGGFFVHPTVYNPEVGVSIFFVNWTAAQRTQYFGTNTLQISIMDFFLHATLFFFYVAVVAVPAIKYVLAHSSRYTKFTAKISFKYSKRQSLHIFLISVLLFVLLIATIIGPLSGKSYTEEYSGNHEIKVLSDQGNYYFDESFAFPSGSSYKYTIYFPQSSIPYSIAWGTVNSSTRSDIQALISNLQSRYENNNLSYVKYITLYQTNISHIIPTNWQISTFNYSTAITISGSGNAFAYGFLLYHWNITQFFIRQINTSLSIVINRTSTYYLALYISLLSTFFILIDILYLLKNKTFA